MMSRALALALLVGSTAAAAPPPVKVVELYQSQGCSSCPPALASVAEIAGRPDILALNFAVTYWDQLGWKDIFAKPQYTARQSAYAKRFGSAQVFTPQLIVNGTGNVVGGSRAKLDAALTAARPLAGPALTFAGGRVSVAASATPLDVWLVRYDPRTIQVAVKAGENGGRTLPHRNIVRELVRLGAAGPAAISFAVPAAAPGLATAAFVQAGPGGPIVSAARG